MRLLNFRPGPCVLGGMLPRLLISILTVLLVACSGNDFESAPQKAAVAGSAGTGLVGEAGDTGSGGSSGKGSAGKGGSSGTAGSGVGGTAAGMPGVGGSSAGTPGQGGSSAGHGGSATAGTGGSDQGGTDAGGDAGMAGDDGTGGTDMGTGGTDVGTGGTDATGGTGGSTGGTDATGGTGGSTGGTDATGGTGGSTGGTTGGSAGAGATGGTGGSTGGSAGLGGMGGSAGSAAGMGGSSAGSGPTCLLTGTVCRVAVNECDQPEVYDADCNCPADLLKANGSSCGSSSSNSCDDADTCQAGVCKSNHKSAGTFCGGQDVNNCRADECNGNGTCVPNQPAFAGSTCGTAACSAGIVTSTGVCDGVNTGCNQNTDECYGPCNAGNTACQYPGIQQVYTTSDASLGDVSTNSDYIYFSHGLNAGSSKTITRIAKNNWSSTNTVYTGTNGTGNAMLATNTALYFTEGGSINCVPSAGGTVRTVASGHNPYVLVTDGVSVFWSDHQDSDAASTMNHIYKTPVTSCTANAGSPVKVATGGAWIMPNIVVTSTSIYYMGVMSGSPAISQIQNCSGGNCLPVGDILNPVFNGPGYMSLSGSSVYFFASTSSVSNRFWSFSTVGDISSTATNLNSTVYGYGSYSNFVAGDSYFYMRNLRIPLAGGTNTATKWAPHLTASEDRDESFVYFVSSGYWTSLANDSTETADVTNQKGLYLTTL